MTMKLTKAASFVLGLLASSPYVGAVSNEQQKTATNLRARTLEGETLEGTMLIAEIQYADRTDGSILAVELDSGEIVDTDVQDPKGWALSNNGRSGETRVAVTCDERGNSGKCMNARATVKSNNGQGRRSGRRLATGNKDTLAVRVIAPDSTTSASEAAISDAVFGTSGDPVNLRSQYKACSYDQLDFATVTATATANGDTIADGVTTVTIAQSVNGVSDGTVRNAVLSALGSRANYDYTLLCLPPGTSGSWIAYAYINSDVSVYNNNWCLYVSGQMHELGHNIGLAHSGETATYDDQSGMMGYSYSNDDGPVMCFNAAKNWQLGWYSDKQLDVSTSWSGNLFGISDYGNIAQGEMVVLRLSGASDYDYYVSFNRKSGINSGTVEGGNQVLVHRRSKGTGYGESDLLAKLSAGGSYNGGPLTITVNSINTGANPAFATVTIGNPSPPTPPPTNVPTPSPTPAPTPAPTNPSPTPAPTNAPTPKPTTAAPTAAPNTPVPTRLPSASPTGSPTLPGVCSDETGRCSTAADCDCSSVRRNLLQDESSRKLQNCCDGFSGGSACRGAYQAEAGGEAICNWQGGNCIHVASYCPQITQAPTGSPVAAPCDCLIGTPEPTPAPTNPPVSSPSGCASITSGGTCNKDPNCYWDKGYCYTSPAGGQAQDACSKKDESCKSNVECCSGGCKSNGRCE